MVKSKLTKKYSGPAHLWQMKRIKEEAQLRKEYGYKNKKEIWKMGSILRKFRAQARRLIPLTDKQANLERKQLIDKLVKLGLVKAGAQIEDVLALNIRDILGRRLQTILVKKGLARTVRQARQFITHGHIVIGEKKVKSPSHLVTVEEESLVAFSPESNLASIDHPERIIKKKEVPPSSKPVEEKEKVDEDEEELGEDNE